MNSLEKNEYLLNFIADCMENRKVTVMKKGLEVVVNSHGSFICSIEPKGGKLQPQKNLTENYKINEGIFSRFDFVLNLMNPD